MVLVIPAWNQDYRFVILGANVMLVEINIILSKHGHNKHKHLLMIEVKDNRIFRREFG